MNTDRTPTRTRKAAYINARVDAHLKIQAEQTLRLVGVSTTDAITMLLHQIVLHKGLPFDVRVPNKATISAMKALNAGKGEAHTGKTSDIFDAIVKEK